MKKIDIYLANTDSQRHLAAAMLTLLPAVATQAQEDEQDAPEQPVGRGWQRMIEEDELPEEEQPVFSIYDYMDEIIAIVILVVIIAVVRHLVDRRHRTGCTFFIIFFAAIFYVIWRYLL